MKIYTTIIAILKIVIMVLVGFMTLQVVTFGRVIVPSLSSQLWRIGYNNIFRLKQKQVLVPIVDAVFVANNERFRVTDDFVFCYETSSVGQFVFMIHEKTPTGARDVLVSYDLETIFAVIDRNSLMIYDAKIRSYQERGFVKSDISLSFVKNSLYINGVKVALIKKFDPDIYF